MRRRLRILALLIALPMVAMGQEPGSRYVVTMAEELRPDEAEALASVYGGRLEHDGDANARQFVVRIDPARAGAMRLDPRVKSVVEQSRHMVPRPTGTGNMTFNSYTYDGAGNIATMQTASGQEQYVYDSVGRLKSATAGVTNSQTYSYDVYGNRTAVGSTGINCTGDSVCAQSGIYETSRTNHLNNNGAAYDAAGNLTAYGGDKYAFDAAGMLARAAMATTDRQFLYTADDERIAIYDGAFNWRWTVRASDAKVLREFTSTNDGSGGLGTTNRQWVKDYVWRDGLLLATDSRTSAGGTVTYHYHLDHLGTPRLVTDAVGLKVSTHTYHAFGAELKGQAESPEMAMKFTGHERDITGTSDVLDDMHARYYSPLQGRLLAPDPVSGYQHVPQSWNRYSYVMNNPINNTDPSGRCTVSIVCLNYQKTEDEITVTTAPPQQEGTWAAVVEDMAIGTAQGYTAIEQRAASDAKYFSVGANAVGPDYNEFLLAMPLAAAVVPRVGAAALTSLGASSSRVFWSGQFAEDAAAAWARQNGASTLEMTATGQALESATATLGREATREAWTSAAREWAAGAAGDVTVFQSANGIRLASTWATIEYPALIANPGITGIRYFLVYANGAVVPVP